MCALALFPLLHLTLQIPKDQQEERKEAETKRGLKRVWNYIWFEGARDSGRLIAERSEALVLLKSLFYQHE